MSNVRRIFVEKKPGFDVEAHSLYRDLKDNLRISGLKKVRIINRYDIEGVSEQEYREAREIIFAEPPVDSVVDEVMDFSPEERVLAIEYLPGQYDQRADSAAQCIQILAHRERPEVRVAKLIVFSGDISETEYQKIKNYCINPLESREASLVKPETLGLETPYPADVPLVDGFINMSEADLEALLNELGLAMSLEDLAFCQRYFRETERRDPTLTEIRVLDTYWSDHCRHTTFLTKIESLEIKDGPYAEAIRTAYHSYLESRKYLYGGAPPEITLMNLATIAMKEYRKRGLLDDLEESDEINACSITVTAMVDGKPEEWLVMFKNETHNHPTEIEPFGGAATCLGGAIRDPLSGRSYVYHAMRVTGSADPRTPIDDTLPGKLPQRTITTKAAAGFSSYGNQIGLTTGQVTEVYDPDFVAKRMELGAVIGAAPRKNVVRGKPEPGDVIILLGGRTGRDGCGGATGSSKEHTEESLQTCGAEVQKGNPSIERKIQRLFRNPEISRIIKKCNDFGAGGVSVAIGELARGLEISLDAVPKKYEGLDGTELAISESQERMAVLVAPKDVETFCKAAAIENLEATVVAKVTAEPRLKMFWRGRAIVDISREFLDTSGVRQTTTVVVNSPAESENPLNVVPPEVLAKLPDLKEAWLANLGRLNICSQKGLIERFDSTIGAGTVLMPFGGKHQLTPAETMVAKLPVLEGDTATGTAMAYGYNPVIGKWSPFHGGLYAVVESVAKIVAAGGDYRKIRLSLQEYFEKLGKTPEKWGKPFAALLGAYYAQLKLGIPAIGGKDSMSGTFKDLSVPPTLVSFALDTVDVTKTISPEFKEAGSSVVWLRLNKDRHLLPDFDELDRNYRTVHDLINQGKISAAHSVRDGGLAAAVTKMCFGNRIGFKFTAQLEPERLFLPEYGSLVLEIPAGEDPAGLLKGLNYQTLGVTQAEPEIDFKGTVIDLSEALEKWQEPLEKIFPTKVEIIPGEPQAFHFERKGTFKPKVSIVKPRIFMPVFPGTNCEYDTQKAFEKAGGLVETLVFRNLTATDIVESLDQMVAKINNSQIIMLLGGFSASDEPDGSGKFVATVFRNDKVKEAVMKLLQERDGLILGICNGFQALIKLGLVPYGEIREITSDSPTLTYNNIGRHVSRLVRTRVASNLSPWLSKVKVGDIHTIPVSHGEGRFVASKELIAALAKNGQIATQYVDLDGKPTYDIRYNPNGSLEAIEGITSPDGRVLGKMGHSERIGSNLYKNVPGEKDQRIFEAGVEYFK
ncbi:MAG: phosphoribosylformylglycinamidine synthase [Firmicutes bacterium]|nr:phosphoribosylformylglycinamidine synthase [Bacillota bacterium]